MKKFSKLKTSVIILMGAFISILAESTYANDLYGTFPAEFNLTNLNGKNGLVIKGVNSNTLTGAWVSEAGDVNGDGIADILIRAIDAQEEGQIYVVFGSKELWPAAINLADLNGNNGFLINGTGLFNSKVYLTIGSGTGDVNGDGIADILIGAPKANNDKGQSYVVFGHKKPWPAVFNLSDLNGNNGFSINGIHPNDFSGFSVSGAGDINRDGIADILIGAPSANDLRGQSYVVFGSKASWPVEIDLADLNGKNGFAINGISKFYSSGVSVSGAGDFNGDGIDDILINGVNDYVVFGSKNLWPRVFNLTNLDGKNGLAIKGSSFDARRAGDVNGDGIVDILLGALVNKNSGQSYIVFGSNGAWPAAIDLADLNGKNGFAIYHNIMNDMYLGEVNGIDSVHGAGDFNGDGIDDILIGFYGANNEAGQSYVIFGSRAPWAAQFNLTKLNGGNGFVLNGVNQDVASGVSVSGAGDFNGDGIDDILIGAPGPHNHPGTCYIVFGQR